jgi:hypothetical protein
MGGATQQNEQHRSRESQLRTWWPSGDEHVWTLDQHLWIAESTPTTAWSLSWSFGERATFALGLATDALRAGGERADSAYFSVWRQDAPYQVQRVTTAIEAGRFYCLRVRRLGLVDIDHFSAWIRDEATGHEVHLGRISIHREDAGCAIYNSTVYFGPDLPRDLVPPSVVYWTTPRLNERPDGSCQIVPVLGASESSGAMAGVVMPWHFGWTHGARVRAGGPP